MILIYLLDFFATKKSPFPISIYLFRFIPKTIVSLNTNY